MIFVLRKKLNCGLLVCAFLVFFAVKSFALAPMVYYATISIAAHLATLVGAYLLLQDSAQKTETKITSVNLTTGEVDVQPEPVYETTTSGKRFYAGAGLPSWVTSLPKDANGNYTGMWSRINECVQNYGQAYCRDWAASLCGGGFLGRVEEIHYEYRCFPDSPPTITGQPLQKQPDGSYKSPDVAGKPVDLYPQQSQVPPNTVVTKGSGGETITTKTYADGRKDVTTQYPDGSTRVELTDASGTTGTTTTSGGTGSGGIVDALRSMFGSGSGSGAESLQGTSLQGDGFDESLEDVEKDSITTKITSFIASNPIKNIFQSSAVTASADVCSFTCSLWGHPVSIDFCPYSSYVEIFGSLFLVVGTVYSFFVAWGRA